MTSLPILQVDDTEHATILAALTFYLQSGQGEPCNRDDEIHDLATAEDDVISLDAAGIEALIQKIQNAPPASLYYVRADVPDSTDDCSVLVRAESIDAAIQGWRDWRATFIGPDEDDEEPDPNIMPIRVFLIPDDASGPIGWEHIVWENGAAT